VGPLRKLVLMHLKEIIAKGFEGHNIGNGSHGRTKRIEDIVAELLKREHGSIFEIGGGYGVTACAILNSVIKFGGQLYVIDPWEDEFDGGHNRYTLDAFQVVMNVLAEHETNFIPDRHLVICRLRSQDENAKHLMLTQKPILFGFVDGLQTYDAVVSDINALMTAGCRVLCVDDINRTPVKNAIDSTIRAVGRYQEYSPSIPEVIESYFVLDEELD